MQKEHYVGLDIGTSRVRCVIGVYDNDGSNLPAIVGHGEAVNQGMRRGIVVHVDDVAEAINKAVTEAERISGIPIRKATVNVNGIQIQGMNSHGVIAISTANREITDDDRIRVEEAATIVNLPLNREIVQFFAKNYSLDGQKNIKDPVSMHGVRLEVEAHIVTASTPSLKNEDMALKKAEIDPSHHTVSSLAAAEAVLTRQQKEAGTALIDIGAGTTNLIVFEDGEVQHIAVIPMCGQHITNDLAIGLKTDLDIAEQVKIQHVNLSPNAKKMNAMVKVGNKAYNFKFEEIAMIVEARVEELLEYVDKELQRIKRSRKLPGGIVLTGGGSKLPGLADFTRDKLQLASRLAKLESIGGLADTVSDQSYVVVIGLMLLDMLLLPALPPVNFDAKNSAKNIISKLFSRTKQ